MPVMMSRFPISCPFVNCSLRIRYERIITRKYVNVSTTDPYLISILVKAYMLMKSTAKDMPYMQPLLKRTMIFLT